MNTRLGTAALIVLGLAAPLAAQRSAPSASTPPVEARYEIVQSPLNLRDTFRLDRWSGRTDLLVEQDTKALVWRAVPFRDPPTVTPSGPRFQITVSGVSAKGTYLIDTVTGRTWVLMGAELADATWVPVH